MLEDQAINDGSLEFTSCGAGYTDGGKDRLLNRAASSWLPLRRLGKTIRGGTTFLACQYIDRKRLANGNLTEIQPIGCAKTLQAIDLAGNIWFTVWMNAEEHPVSFQERDGFRWSSVDGWNWANDECSSNSWQGKIDIVDNALVQICADHTSYRKIDGRKILHFESIGLSITQYADGTTTSEQKLPDGLREITAVDAGGNESYRATIAADGISLISFQDYLPMGCSDPKERQRKGIIRLEPDGTLMWRDRYDIRNPGINYKSDGTRIIIDSLRGIRETYYPDQSKVIEWLREQMTLRQRSDGTSTMERVFDTNLREMVYRDFYGDHLHTIRVDTKGNIVYFQTGDRIYTTIDGENWQVSWRPESLKVAFLLNAADAVIMKSLEGRGELVHCADGQIVIARSDGTTKTQQQDGTLVITQITGDRISTHVDGTVIEERKILNNTHQKILVRNCKGRVRHQIILSSEGIPVSFRIRNGETWKSTDGYHWTNLEQSPADHSKSSWLGTIEIDQWGNLIQKNPEFIWHHGRNGTSIFHINQEIPDGKSGQHTDLVLQFVDTVEFFGPNAKKHNTLLAKLKSSLRQVSQDIKKFRCGQDEIEECYRNLGRVLTAESSQSLSFFDRMTVAEECLANLINPGSINQGHRGTCTVAATETVMYVKAPSRAIQLVADVFLNGSFQTKDGTTIRLYPASRTPDREASPRGAKKRARLRNYASQLFQLTAVNVFWQRDRNEGIGGIIQYRQQKDTEYLWDTKVHGRRTEGNDNQPTTSPSLGMKNLADIYSQITGESIDTVVAITQSSTTMMPGVTGYETEEDLQRLLDKMSKANELPVVTDVHCGERPFLTRNILEPRWHAITIRSYHNSEVEITNSWGEDDISLKSTRLSVSQLYSAGTNLTGVLFRFQSLLVIGSGTLSPIHNALIWLVICQKA